MLVEKNQRIECLILGIGCHIAIDRQMRQEFNHFLIMHILRMPLVVIQDESFGPLEIGVFRPDAVIPDPYSALQLFQ